MSSKLTIITEEEANIFIKEMIKYNVSNVWRGYGTTIFIEIGILTTQENEKNPSGEFTISIEGTWRIDAGEKIVLGTDNDDKMLNEGIKNLINLTITNINFFARLKEIEIEFDNHLWLSSFEMTDGDPQWAIKKNRTWLYLKSNKFVLEEN